MRPHSEAPNSDLRHFCHTPPMTSYGSGGWRHKVYYVDNNGLPMGDENMRPLPVPMTDHDGGLAPAELLAKVPEEGVWLANFPSPRTRATYRNAVAEFVGFLGLGSAEELYRLEQAHVIARREELTRQGAERPHHRQPPLRPLLALQAPLREAAVRGEPRRRRQAPTGHRPDGRDRSALTCTGARHA